jgi:CheY-like chemotaxis protein
VRTLGERIKIVLSLAPDLWNVYIDERHFEDALLNLSVNARDAMPAGGKLIYETTNTSLDEDYVSSNHGVIPGDYVLISITDTGDGMTAETIEKAFDPFFTTKEIGKGSGLGLSMVYGFVKQSSGHIKIYSEVGYGTSIKIYLPKADSAVSAEDKKEEIAQIELENGSKTILVVEDSKDVLKLTSSMLKSLGYNVIESVSGDSAIKIIESGEKIDLLLTDVMLAGKLNGPNLAAQAVVIRPDLKVLFNSGYAKHAIFQGGFLEEGVDLITKPFRKPQLAEKLREIFKRT